MVLYAVGRDVARLCAIVALAALLVLFVATLFARIPTLSAEALSVASQGGGDGPLFAAVVARVRSGESYYDAMGAEMRGRGYPVASVFNWRLPALYVALSRVPSSMTVVLLGALGAATLVCFMIFFARRVSPEGTVLGLVIAAAAISTMASPACRLLSESWSGLFVGLSVVSYAWTLWVPAATLGLSALFVRELAAPYCAVCAVLAARARRKTELAVWLAGFGAFGAYYLAHVSEIRVHQPPGGLAHPTWVQWGGLPFWLLTLQANEAFHVAPRPLLAGLSVLLVSSLWAPAAPVHVRGTVIAYGLVFAVAGQSFNDYWGFVPGLAYAFALSYGPSGIRALVRAAGTQTSAAPADRR
jgi:hypothetical protein